MANYLKGMALGAGLMIIDLLNAAIRDLHFVLGSRQPNKYSLQMLLYTQRTWFQQVGPNLGNGACKRAGSTLVGAGGPNVI
jgi:hypothetical protein